MATTHSQIALWANDYLTMQNEVKALEAQMKVIKENLLMSVPAGTELSADGRRIVHSIFEKTALNQTLLKTQFPDVFAECSEKKTETRLTVR